MSGVADLKAASRRALHERLAVSCVYDDGEATNDRATVRWHNKLVTSGELQGGFDVTVVEGIERLIFNQTNLTLAGLTLVKNAVVTIPELNATFTLDHSEPGDGPENVYWSVSREREG